MELRVPSRLLELRGPSLSRGSAGRSGHGWSLGLDEPRGSQIEEESYGRESVDILRFGMVWEKRHKVE